MPISGALISVPRPSQIRCSPPAVAPASPRGCPLDLGRRQTLVSTARLKLLPSCYNASRLFLIPSRWLYFFSNCETYSSCCCNMSKFFYRVERSSLTMARATLHVPRRHFGDGDQGECRSMATPVSLLPSHSKGVHASGTLLLSYLKNVTVYNSFPHLFYMFSVNNSRCRRLSAKSMVDGTRSGPPESDNKTTRLIRTIQSLQTKLSSRMKELMRGFSVKVLFFLVGFYCATAFATVIGQTGDWDILSAGLAVVVVEVIGAVMYRASSRYLGGIRDLITMFNYWKAGLSLGLFLDSFKYEVDTILEKCNLFNIDIDVLHIFC